VAIGYPDLVSVFSQARTLSQDRAGGSKSSAFTMGRLSPDLRWSPSGDHEASTDGRLGPEP